MAKKAGVALATIVILGIIFLFLISLANPGNPLYALKVNVAEEVVEYGYVTAPAKADYHLSLLDRRLHEAEVLAERSPGNQGDAEYLFAETGERAQELTDLLAAKEGTAFTREESLMLTHELLVRLRAIEEAAERSESIADFSDPIEETRREMAKVFDARADQLAVHGTSEEVSAFLNGLLESLLTKVEVGTMSDGTRRSVERAVKNAQEDIEALKPGDAIATLGDALRLIEVEELLGPDPDDVEGSTPEASPTENGTSSATTSNETATNTATSSAATP